MNAPVAKIETLPIASIVRDPALNCRAAGVDESIAREYAGAIANGATFPPVVVFKEGSIYRLGDGWHRVRSHELANKTSILCEVRRGGERECRLFAIGSNAAHGARRTNNDKRRAVVLLLDDPEWSKLSSREIAKLAAVDDKFVGTVRRELAPTADAPQSDERVGADGKSRKLPKRKKAKPFNAGRAAKAATAALAAVVKRWPANEPTAPLVEAVQAWLASVQSKAGAA